MMIEGLGVHRADPGNIIGHAAKVRKQIRQFHAALAVLLPGSRAAKNRRGVFLQKRKADILSE